MNIELRPLSAQPLSIGEEEYRRLVNKSEGGWSRCADVTEWLAKLHYLRDGLKTGKLDRTTFEARESRLVENWLRGRI